jgi:hypothetical protein
MNNYSKSGIALAILAVVMVAASSTVLYAHGVKSPPVSAASREAASETRAITAAVTSIEADGAIDLVIRQGAVPSMTVRAEQRLLGNIVTTQNGDKLRIETRGGMFHTRTPMQIEIVVPQLARLDLRGSGDARASGFSGNDIDVGTHGSGDVALTGQFRNVRASINGSGNITLDTGASDSVDLRVNGSGDLSASGKTAVLRGELRGSGDVDAGRLIADSATIRLNGSGDVELNVRSKVELTLNGSGDIHVTGQPTARAVARNGSGEVSWN